MSCSETAAAALAEDIDRARRNTGRMNPLMFSTTPRIARLHTLEHADSAADIAGRDLLRRRDHDCAIEIDRLHERELGITGARGHVHNEVIELAPLDLLEELARGCRRSAARA